MKDFNLKSPIKLIIFDLDGVLVDAKLIHFFALNEALKKFESPEYPKLTISYEEHLSEYDGLPTRVKLNKISEKTGLPKTFHPQIWKLKQELTDSIAKKVLKKDDRLCNLLFRLKTEGYILYVASNSIRNTVKNFLYYTGLIEYIDHYFGNEDVKNNKPSPEIYYKCMLDAGISPEETLILEDSPTGLQAAYRSGANVLQIKSVQDLTYEKINQAICQLKNQSIMFTPKDDKLNIVIPMAGAGSRFEKAGYTFPKPLIDVNGKPMIQIVVENINIDGNYIFIVQKKHIEQFYIDKILKILKPNSKIIEIDGLTEGAAVTVLKAKEFINNDNPLIICNSDQYMEWNSVDFYYKATESQSDGFIVTFNAIHSKWSFVRLDENNKYVVEVAEKNPISNIATTGLYYWKKGSDFVKYAERMIEKNIRVNNEFYVCPVFNEAILDGKKIETYHIEKMWGLGTPEDLNHYLMHFKNE